MTKDKKPAFCWDTSVLLAWLTDDTRHPLEDIKNVFDQMTAGKLVLVVPTVVAFEVSRVKHTAEKFRTFERFLRRTHVRVVDITLPIAMKASEVRDAAMRESKDLKRADALVLAAAILHRVEELHTVDGDHLLRLNGTPAACGIPIVKPRGARGERSLLSYVPSK